MGGQPRIRPGFLWAGDPAVFHIGALWLIAIGVVGALLAAVCRSSHWPLSRPRLGGKLTYTHGVRVVDESDQADGYA